MSPILPTDEERASAVNGVSTPGQHPFGETPTVTEERPRYGLLDRISHMFARLDVDSWSWYLWPMTTLGMSTLLHDQKSVKGCDGLYVIGLIGLVEFILVIAVKTAKALICKRTLVRSLSTPAEALFFSTFWISLYGSINGAIDFAAPAPGSALATAFFAFFWIYLICALCAGVGLHLMVSEEGARQGALAEGIPPSVHLLDILIANPLVHRYRSDDTSLAPTCIAVHPHGGDGGELV